MNNIGVNLDNIKVAIFDFDDTLAIHDDREFLKHRSKNEETYLNFYLNAYLIQKLFMKVLNLVINRIHYIKLLIF